MGFFEDDRIRNKNRHYDEAFEIYEGLKAFGYSNQEILEYAKFALDNTDDPYRNKVFNTMISIVGRIGDGKNK